MSLEEILSTIKDPTLTSNQRFTAMAKAAESFYDPIVVSDKTRAFMDEDIVFDMWEGKMPFRPRYILPDYEKFLAEGSKFLMLDAPNTLQEALSYLLIFYYNVTSASNLPVYIGHLDRMLEPFVQKVPYEEAYKAIELFILHIDRTIADAFCHCNIGPHDTITGRILLDISAKAQRPTPNMSFIYNEETPDEFAIKAIEAGLICSKPSFANDRMYSKDWGSNYAIVSCYNALQIGGGGSTLCRLNLKRLAEKATSPEHLLDTLIPEATLAMCELLDTRVKFIVEEAKFFENDFLAKEGFIHQDRFISMFGLVGLAECVNISNGFVETKDRFGHNEAATVFGEAVLDKINESIKLYTPQYGPILMHAQVGVDTDLGMSPGTRIPVNEDVPLFDHLQVTARMHKHFSTGTGDIYPFDETVNKNPAYILDIIKGAFAINTRYFSFYSSDADVVRITGYLVKRSDMEDYKAGKATLANATGIGYGAASKNSLINRQVRSVEAND